MAHDQTYWMIPSAVGPILMMAAARKKGQKPSKAARMIGIVVLSITLPILVALVGYGSYQIYMGPGFTEQDATNAATEITQQYAGKGIQLHGAQFVIMSSKRMKGYIEIPVDGGSYMTVPCSADIGHNGRYLVQCVPE